MIVIRGYIYEFQGNDERRLSLFGEAAPIPVEKGEKFVCLKTIVVSNSKMTFVPMVTPNGQARTYCFYDTELLRADVEFDGEHSNWRIRNGASEEGNCFREERCSNSAV